MAACSISVGFGACDSRLRRRRISAIESLMSRATPKRAAGVFQCSLVRDRALALRLHLALVVVAQLLRREVELLAGALPLVHHVCDLLQRHLGPDDAVVGHRDQLVDRRYVDLRRHHPVGRDVGCATGDVVRLVAQDGGRPISELRAVGERYDEEQAEEQLLLAVGHLGPEVAPAY
eukprot:5554481-Prymnesium_polylepis.1